MLLALNAVDTMEWEGLHGRVRPAVLNCRFVLIKCVGKGPRRTPCKIAGSIPRLHRGQQVNVVTSDSGCITRAASVTFVLYWLSNTLKLVINPHTL